MVEHLFRFFGQEPAVFLKSAFEVSLISLFLICLAHSWFTHGWKRTLREFVAGFFMGCRCQSLTLNTMC